MGTSIEQLAGGQGIAEGGVEGQKGSVNVEIGFQAEPDDLRMQHEAEGKRVKLVAGLEEERECVGIGNGIVGEVKGEEEEGEARGVGAEEAEDDGVVGEDVGAGAEAGEDGEGVGGMGRVAEGDGGDETAGEARGEGVLLLGFDDVGVDLVELLDCLGGAEEVGERGTVHQSRRGGEGKKRLSCHPDQESHQTRSYSMFYAKQADLEVWSTLTHWLHMQTVT